MMNQMEMPQAKPAERQYTIEEYFRIEADSSEKHEYRYGQIVAMAGGTESHSLIIANVIREVGSRLKGKRCRVYDSNLRVRLKRKTIYSYPDVSVMSGESQFDPDDSKRMTVLNPGLVVEVLSQASEGFDRGEKFSRYRDIESLAEYVLVAQDRASVETFFRQEDGTWLFSPAVGLETTVRLRSLDVDLPLSEVYASVEFPPLVEPTGLLQPPPLPQES